VEHQDALVGRESSAERHAGRFLLALCETGTG
jgi:hypothetical protein